MESAKNGFCFFLKSLEEGGLLKTPLYNIFCISWLVKLSCTQPAITCSKLTIETLEQGVKYVQS